VDAWPHSRISFGKITGLVSYAVAALTLFCPAWRLPGGLLLAPVALPLFAYFGLTMVACFFPGWSYFMPVVCHGPRDRRVVALSFDDGPNPETTPRLLDLLARHGVKAAFFVVGNSVKAHPQLLRRIKDEGHEIGNHSMSHAPFLMVTTAHRLAREIAACQATLMDHGVRPLVFRPPVGITNSVLPQVLAQLDLGCVCFSCRPLDFGNRWVEGIARKILGSVQGGDIVLLHDTAPHKSTTVEAWLSQVEKVILGLRERSFEVVKLSELIGRPLMAGTPAPVAAHELVAHAEPATQPGSA
jgi:peptidoglycan/xylan/chitin deacetylase (PgdA/CDA1 family)